jgi:hypothetical protein
MNGDLSVAPRPVALGLAPSARPASAGASTTTSQVRPLTDPVLAGVERAETERVKALLTDPATRVSMHRDEASGHVVVRVHDRTTDEVIEQIPADELLRLYAGLRETLVDERA